MKEGKVRSWFWPVQLSAWIIVALANFLVQYGKVPAFFLYMNVVDTAGGGLLITTIFRYYLKKRNYNFRLKAGKFIAFLLFSSFIQSVCWMVLIVLIALPFYKTHPVNLFSILPDIFVCFILTAVWTIIYIIYHLLIQYHRTEVAHWQLESAIQKAQLEALKAQINPHFIFNALNNIRALVLENPVQARDMITRFSALFRYALQHAADREVCAADEIAILTAYLELLKVQYEDKLQYHIDVPAHLLNELIPPMTLQLLVENAVKHGIGLSSKGGEIRISLEKDGTKLILSVKNTGKLQPVSHSEERTGTGLTNIKERLKLLYGDNAVLQLQEEGNFVRVTIILDRPL